MVKYEIVKIIGEPYFSTCQAWIIEVIVRNLDTRICYRNELHFSEEKDAMRVQIKDIFELDNIIIESPGPSILLED